MALTVEVTEVLLATCSDGHVSIGHTLVVNVGSQFGIHCAVTGSNHCGEPLNLSRCAKIEETVGFCTHPVNLGSRADCAKTCCCVIVVIIPRAPFRVAECNTALGVACTVEVCNLIYSGTGDWQGNGVGIGEILSEGMSIGIGIGSQIATQCRVQEIANLAAVQRIGCHVCGVLALETAAAVESVIAVGNRTVLAAEELIGAVQYANLCNVQAIPHLGIAASRLVPSAESRTSIDSVNATCIHTVLHIEVGILLAASTNHTCGARSCGQCCIADTVENLKSIACASIGLDKADDRADAILTFDGACGIHDDVLDLGIATAEAEETKCLVIRAVNHQMADGVELAIELTSKLVSVTSTSILLGVSSNRSMVNASHVNVSSQNCLSRETGT